ncbi:MAG: signal peptidase II [Actinobacteria bacterium]|nr:signal peptidase II [Actinomycetota bacterium]
MDAPSTKAVDVRRLRLLCIGIGVVGYVVDLATKNLALANLDPQHPIPLLGGLVNLQLIRNPGAAFSMGENLTVVLSAVALAALVAVLGWVVPRIRHVGWAVAIGLLLAGITGNLSDRLFREPGPFRGHVVDFIQLPHFAIVNVADIFITSAAVLVIWLSMITQVSLGGVRLKERPDTDDE